MQLITAGGFPGRLSIAADMTTPDFREYHQDLISDKIDMLKAEAKAQYGMIHLREALRNMRTVRFEEAVALVGAFTPVSRRLRACALVTMVGIITV